MEGRWKVVLSCSMILVPPGGVAYGFTSLLPYLLSRLHNVQPSCDITATHLSWLYALLVTGQSLCMILGGLLEQYASTQRIALTSTLAFNVTLLSMYWACNDFVALCFSYFIIGCLIGVLYITALVAGLSWAGPEKGLVSGVLCLGFGLSSVMVCPLQSLYINPENLPATNVSGQYIFPQISVVSRVPTMFLFFALISLLIQTPLTYFMKKQQQDDKEVTESILSTKAMLRTKEFYILFTIFMLNKSPLLYVATYAKVFGETFESNDRLLSVVIGLCGVFNAVGRPFWGYISDRFTFKAALFAVCLLTAMSTLVTYFSKFMHTAVFAVGVWASYFCCCGNYAIFPAAAIYYFGQGGTKYGTLYLSQALGALFSALIDGLVPQWLPIVITVSIVSVMSAGLTLGLMYVPTVRGEVDRQPLLEPEGLEMTDSTDFSYRKADR